MACYTSPRKTIWLLIVLCQFVQIILARNRFGGSNLFADSPLANCIGDKTFRLPANTDITVKCGGKHVFLYILLCPIYYNGYNETLMSLNSLYYKPHCKGYADWDAKPPVLKFNISITEKDISECGSGFRMYELPGTGVFQDYSKIQFINISGTISSYDPTNLAITYFREVLYMFSCSYALQYLINNIKMNVTGVTLAVKDTNGSFWSTLDMRMFGDDLYREALGMPIYLKTRVFVQVKASNLTNRFRVLLDRCYATASPFYAENTHHDLFVGCNIDGQTIMETNGLQQFARFSFEAFRFIYDTDQVVSTYYVHCATRLCIEDICPSLIQNCSARARRSADEPDTSVSDVATVTSGPITIHIKDGVLLSRDDLEGGGKTVVAVSVIAAIIGTICLTLVAFIVYNKYYAKKVPELGKTIMYPRD